MKIVVCLKQVPDTETRVQIVPEGNAIVESDINWIVSPFDEFAIEEALKIKEAKEGEVVLVTVGPDRAQSALRTGLAMGADSAIHVNDPLLEGADNLATARAGAIKTVEGIDLVLCGQQGVGGDNAQVPGLLAELLDLPQVTVAVKIEVQDGKAVVEREIEGARETWETSLPAVISAQKGLNEPRYASLKGIMQAKKKPIQALDAAGVGLDAAAATPKVKVTGMGAPAASPRGQDDRGRSRRAGERARPPPPRRSKGPLMEPTMPGILTFAEQRDGALRRASLEVVSEAARLAGSFGGTVSTVVVGPGTEGLAAELGSYGADKVHVFDDPAYGAYATEAWAAAVAAVIAETSPTVVLFPMTAMGKDLAPRVAARANAGLVSDCVALEAKDGKLTARRPMYAGKAFATVEWEGEPQVASPRPNVFPLAIPTRRTARRSSR